MEKRPVTNAAKLRKHKAGSMTRLKEIQAELVELTEAVKALSERVSKLFSKILVCGSRMVDLSNVTVQDA